MNSKTILGRLVTRVVAAINVAVFAIIASGSHATIPQAERNVLLALFSQTAGASWVNSTGWNGAVGSECSWFGVTCNAGDFNGVKNVIGISVANNNLVGSLPSTLRNLTSLQTFVASGNKLGGSIPSLSGMTALQSFVVYDNQLSGSLPSLNGLSALSLFNVNNNALTGSIPAYTGLSFLSSFFVGDNNLSGPLPSLSGYPNLLRFGAEDNALTGAIPALSGLTQLQDVYLRNNQLTGNIPTFPNSLRSFIASGNQLTGSLPSLSALTQLREFDIANNQLIGSLSSLANLSQLQRFVVAGNQFTGPVPAPPVPSVLAAGGSQLCPNRISRSNSAAWDAATASTPWHLTCTPPYVIAQTSNLSLGGVTINTPSETANVVLSNTSVDDGQATNCSIGGTHAALFAFNPAPSFPLAVPANQSVNLPVQITGTTVGTKTAIVTCTLSAGGTLTGGPTALTATVGLGCLDADGDGDIEASTDMVVLARAALGFTGARVTDGAIVGTPPRNSWALIRAFLNAKCATDYAP